MLELTAEILVLLLELVDLELTVSDIAGELGEMMLGIISWMFLRTISQADLSWTARATLLMISFSLEDSPDSSK